MLIKQRKLVPCLSLQVVGQSDIEASPFQHKQNVVQTIWHVYRYNTVRIDVTISCTSYYGDRQYAITATQYANFDRQPDQDDIIP